MKIRGTNLETSNIGEFEEIKSSINSKDLGLALTMVSKNLYSNPIGSFIRELASNAVDANVDANVNEVVFIHIYQEGDSYYIEFKDNGTGMSPEVFRDIYMSWFNSDKRSDNNKIGGWGIGSKSPLSYQDSFEIITRVDGTEYHYVLANESSAPAATLLTTNKTSNPNGTTIRVEINNSDIYKVHTETVRQLAYFKNIYVKNDVSYYDNTFKLFESEKFILRSVAQPFGTEMHICLGQVAYPINWDVLGLSRITIPVAIKFEIGELDVTLSREEINYTEEVKKRIIAKVTQVEEALLEKYQEQLKIDDFNTYLQILTERKKPAFNLEGVHIVMENVKTTPSFIPLQGIKFVKAHLLDLFALYSIEHITSGRNGGYMNSYNMLDYCANSSMPSTAYLVTDRMNTYDSAYIGTGVALIKRHKFTNKHLPKLAKALGLMANVGEFERGFRVKPVYKDGYIKTIYQVVKYIDRFISDRFTHYNGIASEEWIAQYKEEQRELYEERKQTITHYNIFNNRSTVNWGDLVDRYKVIFYISKEESKEDIIAYQYLYEKLPKYFIDNSTFLIISPSVVNKIKNKKKFVSVDRMFKIKEFNNTLYRIKLSKRLDIEFPHGRTLFQYSEYYMNIYRKLTGLYFYNYETTVDGVPVKNGQYTSSRNITVDVIKHFSDKFDAVKPTKNRKYMPYEEYIEELKQVRDRLDVLRFLTWDIPHNYLVKIIGKLGVLKLRPKYYKKVINN